MVAPSRSLIESSSSGETKRAEFVLIEEISEIARLNPGLARPPRKKRESETINRWPIVDVRSRLWALEANDSNDIYDQRGPRLGRRHRGPIFLVTM